MILIFPSVKYIRRFKKSSANPDVLVLYTLAKAILVTSSIAVKIILLCPYHQMITVSICQRNPNSLICFNCSLIVLILILGLEFFLFSTWYVCFTGSGYRLYLLTTLSILQVEIYLPCSLL